MSDYTAADIGGGCCLFITASLQAFCNTKTYGASGCCGRNNTAGCCGSCCDDSFNEDSFEKHIKKSGAEIATSQPPPAEEMTIPSTSGDMKSTT